MKKIFYITLLVSWATLFVNASTDQKKEIIKTTEDIKYLSQKIANDYLYLYHDPKKIELKAKLQSAIKKLEDDFRFIAKSTNNPDTKNVLDFLSYNKDQMRETLANDISKESASSMLDFSDTLLEGAQSILDMHNINTLKDHEGKFRLMMISKLYMAINLDFDPINNTNEIKKEIALFHNKSSSWYSFKEIVDGKQACFVPNIVSILVKDLENSIGKI